MSLWKRGGRYWTDFTVDGVKYRKPLPTSDRNLARQREREAIEQANHGTPLREKGPRRLFAAISTDLVANRFAVRHARSNWSRSAGA